MFFGLKKASIKAPRSSNPRESGFLAGAFCQDLEEQLEDQRLVIIELLSGQPRPRVFFLSFDF